MRMERSKDCRMRNNRVSTIVIALIVLSCHAIVLASINIVVISGQNNHQWQQTTPALLRLLRQNASFTIEVEEHPENLTADMLRKYDVIVSNYNTFGKQATVRQWPESTQKAYMDFIQQGHGHVTVHAGGSSFYDWPQYHQVTCSWGKGTNHGPQHVFDVRSTHIEHPITHGLKTFTTKDELWNKTDFPEDSQVLLQAFSSPDYKGSNKYESVLAVSNYGRGRCVGLTLGHDAKAISNPGFGRVFLRSVEWAATGSVKHTANSDSTPMDTFTFEDTDHSLTLIKNKKVVWQFNYGKNLTKPYFHPVSLVDGTVLTWESPEDHPWHYGLWFCWKFINGVNYWEEDRKTGKSAGMTEWNNVYVKTDSDNSAQITLELYYHIPDKPVVMSEKRTIVISAPDECGTYMINWTSEFTALADKVELNRTPLPWEKEGKPWGGYAGLSFRACKDVKDAQYISTFGSASPCSKGRYRFKDIAVEYSGSVNDNVFGVAILDHPDNLNSPSPWYLDDGDPMDYFSPAVLCYSPHVMSKGQTLALKYQIIVHPDRWDSNELKKKYELFSTN